MENLASLTGHGSSYTDDSDTLSPPSYAELRVRDVGDMLTVKRIINKLMQLL